MGITGINMSFNTIGRSEEGKHLGLNQSVSERMLRQSQVEGRRKPKREKKDKQRHASCKMKNREG